MKRFGLPLAVVSLLIVLALVVIDLRIKADNARLRKRAFDSVLSSSLQIESSLEHMRDASSKNAASSKAVRSLARKYSNAQQTYEGLNAFKVVFLNAEPQIIGPLVGYSRREMHSHLFTLKWTLDSHASNLMASRDIEEKNSGGLIAALKRSFGPLQ